MTAKITMRTAFLGLSALALAGAGSLAGSLPAAAQDSFYAGKTINVVVRSGPGGGNDFYVRLLARHISPYIPGSPRTQVTNMPGGGGLVAANYMANRASRDGTEIALLGRDLVVVQRLGASGVRFDARTLISLGNMGDDAYVWTVRGTLPFETLGDIRNHPQTIRFAGTGAGTASVQSIGMLRADGYPVQVITGYDTTPERVLAITRGDVDGMSGSYASLRTAIRDENFKILARVGNDAELGNVPHLRNFISADRQAVVALMSAPVEMSRPLYTTPEVPADRVQILRNAIRDVLADPALREEAARANRNVDWTSAEEIEKITQEILSASDAVVEEFKAL